MPYKDPAQARAAAGRWLAKPGNRHKGNLRDKGWRARHPRYRAEKHQVLKRAAILAYGGVCVCCGEDRMEFLSIDHIDGYGGKPRITGRTLYADLHRAGFPRDLRLQVLCMSCNHAKRDRAACPHAAIFRSLVGWDSLLPFNDQKKAIPAIKDLWIQ